MSIVNQLERVMGIEPTLEAWEAAVLPLNYTRESLPGTPAHPHWSSSLREDAKFVMVT